MAAEDPAVTQKVPSTPGLQTLDSMQATSASDPSRTVLHSDPSGGPGPLPKSAPGFPARPPVAPGPQAHESLLKPPYATDKAREGELLKGDLTPESSVAVIRLMCAEAMKQAAIAAAAQLHEGDPLAASLAVNESLKQVLAANLVPAGDSFTGTPGSSSTRPRSKIAQEAV